MAIDISTNKHIATFPSKVASMMGQYGHVYNIVLQANTDNGVLASRGDYVDFDQYEQDSVTANAVEGLITKKAATGNWYVEITKLPATEVLYIYNSPVSEYEQREFQDEKLFYNKAGEVAQGAELKVGDVIEYSDEAFTGTAAAGKAVKYAAGKYVVQ